MKRKKALIIRLSSLGDVIFNIPLANRLKENGYEVTWIVGHKGYDVINNNPAVDKVIYAPLKEWKKQNFIKSFKEYLKIIKQLRAEKFDVAIDTQGLFFKSCIFLMFSGAKKRIIAEDAREFSVIGGNEIIKKSYFGEKTNIVLKYLKYGDFVGLKPSEIKFTLPESNQEQIDKINKILETVDKSKPLIIISPTTTWDTKHWNKYNWLKLVELLSDSYTLIFTGVEQDKEYIDYIINGKNFLNIAGETNLLELAELYKRADLVLSLDSGSTHLARATNKPAIISIFCSTPTWLYAPKGDENKYIALANKGCEPCHKRKCKKKDNKNLCTYSLTPEEVYEKVCKIFQKEGVL